MNKTRWFSNTVTATHNNSIGTVCKHNLITEETLHNDENNMTVLSTILEIQSVQSLLNSNSRRNT